MSTRFICKNRIIGDSICQLKLKISIFVPDYVNGGELFTHLYQREHFTETEVRIYIGEIIIALEHLHKVSINRPAFYL